MNGAFIATALIWITLSGVFVISFYSNVGLTAILTGATVQIALALVVGATWDSDDA